MGGHPALLHDPLTGATRRVTVDWRPAFGGALAVDDGGALREVPAAALSLRSGGFRGDAIHLTWEDGGHRVAVTLDDPATVAALSPHLATRFAEELGRVRRRAAQQRRGLALLATLAGLVVLVPVLAAVAAFVFRDAILDAVVRRLPVAIDARLGELAYQQVAASGRLVRQGPALEAVHQVGRRLVEALPADSSARGFRFRFEVLRDPAVNAFAAPGGLVVVHTGLLAEAESADELAGVLAHEVAHVMARHSLRQVLFQLGLTASLRLLIGFGDGAAETIGAVVARLGSLGFSRDQERDADRRAVELLARARLPAAGLESFFERLGRGGGALPALLSTHPPGTERAAILRRLIAEGRGLPTEPLALDWDTVRRDARPAS